jgi:hypothetical protein
LVFANTNGLDGRRWDTTYGSHMSLTAPCRISCTRYKDNEEKHQDKDNIFSSHYLLVLLLL